MGSHGWMTLLAGLVLAPLPAVLPAQEIRIGSRIRVTAPALRLNRQVGIFQGLAADSLRLDSTIVPLRSVSRLEVSRGRSSAWGRGLWQGAVVGTLVGVGLGVFGCKDDDFLGEGPCTVFTGVIGAGAGMAVGTVMGALTRREKWARVPIQPLLQGGGPIVGLGLTLRVSLPPVRTGR